MSVHGTEIRRPPGSEPAQAGAMHNPPYAGIEAASSSEDDARAIIDGCAISGFDVAIGVNLRSTGLLVQNCSLAGSLAAVKTYWPQPLPSQYYPVVDLGGGPLGSVGNNKFTAGPGWAVLLEGPYDVSAKNNEWSVDPAAIDSRILDKKVDDRLGRVHH